MTIELFREDGYLKSCEARVTRIFENGFSTDQTVFYPVGGGQPGDTGTFRKQSQLPIVGTAIIDCRKDRESGDIVHVLSEESQIPTVDDIVTLQIDWDRRYRLMRMHSCLHMLCVAVPAPVTGGAIRDGSARLDFDLPEPPTREDLESRLNEIILGDHPMTLSWISEQQMSSNPDLVRTMSVAPPTGAGDVRLVKFGTADLQACGGTHVSNSSEIGPIVVESIKNKGKQNRRITVVFAHEEGQR